MHRFQPNLQTNSSDFAKNKFAKKPHKYPPGWAERPPRHPLVTPLHAYIKLIKAWFIFISMIIYTNLSLLAPWLSR